MSGSYDVTVMREDDLWVADIAGLTAATQTDDFDRLDVEVRDLVAGLTDTEPHEFDLRWHHVWGDDDVTGLLVELEEVHHAAAEITARRDELRREIIRRGQAAKLSQRVIADALGLSHQRVNQIARAS